MRLALRNTLVLLGGYAAVLLILAGVAVFQLLMLDANVQKETARLFAQEVAGAVAGPSLDRLLQADQETRKNLKTLIEQLTKHSQVVTSISVVDSNGRVVASDNRVVGSSLLKPELYFGASRKMRFTTFGVFPFSSGAYQLAVPLVQEGRRVGYVLVDLQSRSVAEMNQRMWNSLLLAALLGLLCIAGLGFALHLQLSRRGRTLATTLEAALRGESPRDVPEDDEFAQAMEAAGRAGLEVSRARSRTADERGRLVTLGHILNVGVLLVNPAGQLEFGSRRARELFGCADDAELAQALTNIQAELERGLKRPMREGTEGAHIDVEAPNGHHLRLEIYPLEQGGGEGRLVLVRDRETMKALETDLRLASQLRGLARLYLSVVHDIRAPLAAIVAHVELLSGTFEDGVQPRDAVDQRRKGYVAVLDQELHRLRRSLDGLLNHAALPREELEEFDVGDLILDLDSLLRPQCLRQKVVLSAHIPETPIRHLGARDAMKQALTNIGINALEAMPDGGELELRLEGVDSKAIITIADTGPGIPPDLMNKIFAMHFTTKKSGSGIGLYVARAVVESSGGELQVSSEAGRGAAFRIELPPSSRGS